MVRRYLMLLGAILWALLNSAVPVAAGLHAHGVSAVVSGCLTYSNDGGCSTQNQYALSCPGNQYNATNDPGLATICGTVGTGSAQQLTASMIYSANPTQFALDSCQSGQCLTNASLTSADIITRNNRMHLANINKPYIDPWYAIGPSVVASLEPASSYVDPTGTCVYYANANNDLGGPSIYCRPQPASNDTTDVDVYIQGVDGTNVCSAAGPSSCTGTNGAFVQIKGTYGQNAHNTRVHLHLINTKVGAFCTACATTGAEPGLIEFPSGTATGGPNGAINSVELDNVLCDGNYRASSPFGSAHGRFVCVLDSRTGQVVTGETRIQAYNLTIRNSLCYNTGGDCFTGQNPTHTFSFINSWAFNSPAAGISGDHGEIAELGTSGGSQVTDQQLIYQNWGFYYPSQTNEPEITSAIYETGAPTGNHATLEDVENGLVVTNVGNCLSGPWTAANPCLGNGPAPFSVAGNALFSAGNLAEVDSFVVKGNVVDGDGNYYCLSNAGGQLPGTVGISGTTLNIPYSLAGLGAPTGLFPGYLVHDTAAGSSFTDTKVTSYGTNANGLTTSNYASFIGSVSGGGVLTLPISANMFVPVNTTYPVKNQSGGIVGYIAPGQSGKSTTWNLVTTPGGSTPSGGAGSQIMQAANPSSGSEPGLAPYGGNYILATSEPTLSLNTLVQTTTFDSITESGNWSIGGSWAGGDPGVRAISIAPIAGALGTGSSVALHVACP